MAGSPLTRVVRRFLFWCAVAVAGVAGLAVAAVIFVVSLVASIAAFLLFFIALISVVDSLGVARESDSGSPTLVMTHQNNSDALVCKYTSPFSDRTRCSSPIEPHTEVRLGQDCYIAADVYLVEEATDEEIYYREARCEEWVDAGRTITIDRVGDEFVITDGFPDSPEEP